MKDTYDKLKGWINGKERSQEDTEKSIEKIDTMIESIKSSGLLEKYINTCRGKKDGVITLYNITEKVDGDLDKGLSEGYDFKELVAILKKDNINLHLSSGSRYHGGFYKREYYRSTNKGKKTNDFDTVIGNSDNGKEMISKLEKQILKLEGIMRGKMLNKKIITGVKNSIKSLFKLARPKDQQ